MSLDPVQTKTGREINLPASNRLINVVVLAADLVGYSELVFRSVPNSIAVLRETRTLLTSCIATHTGTVLQTPGDFVLSIFSDFGKALQAAIAAQSNLLAHNCVMPEGKAGHWRIGIAAGEVYVVDDEYYGNAINVAARLQSLAKPGDILFAEDAAAPSQFDGVSFQDLGTRKLKNIDQPVRVIRAFLPNYEKIAKSAQSDLKTSPVLLKHLRKPILRVDTFRDLNGAEESRFMAEALMGEIQLIMSRLSNSISVISPNAKASDQADYVLSGTIQKGGPFLRIVARLTSTANGMTLWAERYECNLGHPFDVQDQISREIVSALQLRLTEGEQAQLVRRGTASGKAWDCFQHAHDIERQFTREGHAQAKRFYHEALSLDPDYLSALVALAFCHLDEVRLGWSQDDAESIAEAERLCERASRAAGQHADISALRAFLYFFQKRWEDARTEMQRSVQLAPQSPQIMGYQGALFDLMGEYRAAIGTYKRALSLSEHAPAWIPSNLGLSYLALGHNEAAEHIFREVLEHYPKYVRAWIGVSVALIRQNKDSDAQNAAEQVRLLDPSFSSVTWARSRPFSDDTLLDAFVADLRAAGLD